MNIDTFEEKPWRYPGVDITDFFNFGFNEDSWKQYCNTLVNKFNVVLFFLILYCMFLQIWLACKGFFYNVVCSDLVVILLDGLITTVKLGVL